MRLTYLHQYFATPGSATGTRSYELARRLVSRGHEVTVVTSNAQLPDLADARGVVRTSVDGIRLIVIPVAYANEMGYRARIGAFVRFACGRRTRRPACRPTSSWRRRRRSRSRCRASSRASRRRAPMVFEVRDLWPEMPIAVGALRNPP